MSHDHGRVVAGLIHERDLCKIREAVCIQVEKIYDSCKEKDCIEDARVLFKNPRKAQWLISKAINVKCRRAEVINVFSDVEAVPFKRGFYTVDVKFFIKVTLDFFVPNQGTFNSRIYTVPGLVVFDKKVILFGSEGNVKIFKSHYVQHGIDDPVKSSLQQDNLPIAKVEVAEPIALNARVEEIVQKCCRDDSICEDNIPRVVAEALGDTDDDIDDIEAVMAGDERGLSVERRVVASIGLFSIIKLARFVQLLIPAFDFCVPNKQCVAATEENPCDLFDTIEFPVDEFFPPQKFDFPGALEQERAMSDDIKD